MILQATGYGVGDVGLVTRGPATIGATNPAIGWNEGGSDRPKQAP